MSVREKTSSVVFTVVTTAKIAPAATTYSPHQGRNLEAASARSASFPSSTYGTTPTRTAINPT